MKRQNTFDVPARGAGCWPGVEPWATPLPGRVHLECLKVPESGLIVMTDREKHSCDIARVVSSGVPELDPEQVVILMSGVGMYPDDVGLTERIVGTGNWREGMPDPWNYCIPARLEGFHWVLSPGWLWARKVVDSSLIVLPDRLDRYEVHCQTMFGYDGPPQIMTEEQIRNHGWELFCMKRPGGWERFLVNTG